MRSGRIHEQDRVVWVGNPAVLEPGSSIKAREVTRTHVAVDPIHGTREERDRDVEWYRRGTEIVSCEEAARRGIEPWVSSLPPSMGGTYQRPPKAVRRAPAFSIFDPRGRADD